MVTSYYPRPILVGSMGNIVSPTGNAAGSMGFHSYGSMADIVSPTGNAAGSMASIVSPTGNAAGSMANIVSPTGNAAGSMGFHSYGSMPHTACSMVFPFVSEPSGHSLIVRHAPPSVVLLGPLDATKLLRVYPHLAACALACTNATLTHQHTNTPTGLIRVTYVWEHTVRSKSTQRAFMEKLKEP